MRTRGGFRGLFKRTGAVAMAAAVLLGAAGFFYVEHRKEALVHNATRWLQNLCSSQPAQWDLSVGKIRGRVFREIRFENIKIEEASRDGAGLSPVFSAQAIEFRYNPLDFISKRAGAGLLVNVEKPKVYWRPSGGVSGERFPFMQWMRRWAVSQREHLHVKIKNLELVMGSNPQTSFNGIQADFNNNRFQAELPLAHLQIPNADLSTVLKIEGGFQLGVMGELDQLEGTLSTEGTVINWVPLPEESSFDFSFSQNALRLESRSLLGGIQAQFEVDFSRDYELTGLLKTDGYPLKNLAPLFGGVPAQAIPGRMDLEMNWRGSLFSPAMEGRARLADVRIGKRAFKAMDIHVSGVYPTVKILEDSRILLTDGSVMKLGSQVIEFKQLFTADIYETLVAASAQEAVLWGPWTIKRPLDINEKPEFLMQRPLGERASLQFRKFNEPSRVETPEKEEMEVGFEYRLRGKNSLKVALREEEGFVGVERKVQF